MIPTKKKKKKKKPKWSMVFKIRYYRMNILLSFVIGNKQFLWTKLHYNFVHAHCTFVIFFTQRTFFCQYTIIFLIVPQKVCNQFISVEEHVFLIFVQNHNSSEQIYVLHFFLKPFENDLMTCEYFEQVTVSHAICLFKPTVREFFLYVPKNGEFLKNGLLIK